MLHQLPEIVLSDRILGKLSEKSLLRFAATHRAGHRIATPLVGLKRSTMINDAVAHWKPQVNAVWRWIWMVKRGYEETELPDHVTVRRIYKWIRKEMVPLLRRKVPDASLRFLGLGLNGSRPVPDLEDNEQQPGFAVSLPYGTRRITFIVYFAPDALAERVEVKFRGWRTALVMEWYLPDWPDGKRRRPGPDYVQATKAETEKIQTDQKHYVAYQILRRLFAYY